MRISLLRSIQKMSQDGLEQVGLLRLGGEPRAGAAPLDVADHQGKLSKIVNLVDRLCVMNEGSFICEGAPDQVLNDRAVRECYWGKGEVTLS